MGSISKLEQKKGTVYRAAVYLPDGSRPTKRFSRRKDAKQWIAEQEAHGKGEVVPDSAGRTFRELIERYMREVSTTKKSGEWEAAYLGKSLSLYPYVADKPLHRLTQKDGERVLKQITDRDLAANSVRREFSLYNTVLNQAVRWRWIERNPWRHIKMPKAGPPRNLLVTDYERALLRRYSGLEQELRTGFVDSNPAQVCLAFEFSVETGMRVGEIINLQESWVEVFPNGQGKVNLPAGVTKNGLPREVPLTRKAVKYLDCLPPVGGRYWSSVASPNAASNAFARLRFNAGLSRNITLHDARHAACTWMARKLNDPMALARILGHSDLKMVMVYFNPSTESLAEQMEGEVQADLLVPDAATVAGQLDGDGVDRQRPIR